MELIYRFYCFMHKTAKKILGARITSNDYKGGIPNKLHLGVTDLEAKDFWKRFIENSVISDEAKNTGILYAGYIADISSWCHSSWIWTNAASVRTYCEIGYLSKALFLAEKLALLQLECGGWIVRNDYDSEGPVPMLAANDSAYIANNAFLSLYEKTKDKRYIDISIRCADWIIETARPDGMVPIGYNVKLNKWEKVNIVDTGFTAALFANLFKFTGKIKYREFLMRFIDKYIDLFFIPSKNGFSTSIDENDKQIGGMFSRGQAWALEGLIPAYKILQSDKIKTVIDKTVNTLLQKQNKNGSWPYNLTKPLLGEDCKGVSVIAKNLMDWNELFPNDKIINGSKKALSWCFNHTSKDGPAQGGIFSFCMEGAIVYHLYTSTAFVYSSAYAIELYNRLYK